MDHPKDWTQEQLHLLEKLHRQGYSAREIAGRIGKTRNAVLGRIYRLRSRDPEWGAPTEPKPAPAPPEPVIVAPPPAPEPVVPAAPPRPFLTRYPEPALCATSGCRNPRQPGRALCADCHTHRHVAAMPVVNRAPAPFHHGTGRPRLARSE